MEQLETDRIILRHFIQSDLDEFYEYAKVDGVGEMAGWKHHTTKEITQNILNIFMKDVNTFAIVYKDSNKVIGSISIKDTNYKGEIRKEIGYVISKSYWDMGIATETTQKVIEYAFSIGIDTLWCSHFDFNKKSKRVIQKCGFKFFETTKNEILNEMHTNLIYKLTKDSLLGRRTFCL